MAQLIHFSPLALEYFPGAHDVHKVLPSSEDSPTAHSTQFVRSGMLLAMPRGHSWHEIMPDVLPNIPGKQDRQAVEPVEFRYIPARHGVHEVDPGWRLKRPLAQSAHGAPPRLDMFRPSFPAGQFAHTMLPSSSVYVPTAHSTQPVAFGTALAVPAAQS